MKKLFLILALSLISSVFAVNDLPNSQPKVDEIFWNDVLDKTWQGMKKRMIDPYEKGQVGPGLIHRPKSEYPGDAVSESVGYGMLVALFADDQETFNKIFDAANKYMWNGSYYDWHLKPDGEMEGGAATDAEEDIILSLVFAQKLVDVGLWKNHNTKIIESRVGKFNEETLRLEYVETYTERSYMEHALVMMGKMWSTSQITRYGTLAPGADWGGEDFVNAGYFSPAWYKIFAKYDKAHDWNLVVDRSYEIIGKSPGYTLGMVPDWMTPSGITDVDVGYNAYAKGNYFFKDAIRVLWRVAIDAVWFDDERAKNFLTNAMNFINSKGGASAANFFMMDGTLVPESDTWNDMMGGTITRHRREHSPLTIGMWSTAAMAVGTDEDKQAFSDEMKKFYDGTKYNIEGADYFGLAMDFSGMEEDTLHNEMYFEQFLAWFSTSLMTGAFCNMDDIIDGILRDGKKPIAVEVNGKKEIQIVDPSEDEDPDKQDPSSGKEENTFIGAQQNIFTLTISHNNHQLVMETSEINATWTLFNTKGEKIASLQGNRIVLDASDLHGKFFVKVKTLSGMTQVKGILIP